MEVEKLVTCPGGSILRLQLIIQEMDFQMAQDLVR